jgi:hypothetical protein
VLAVAPRKLICVRGIAVAVPGSGEIVTVDADAPAGAASAAASNVSTAERWRMFIEASPPGGGAVGRAGMLLPQHAGPPGGPHGIPHRAGVGRSLPDQKTGVSV